MIRIDRPPMPEVLRRKAEQWRDRLLSAATPQERQRLLNKYRHKQIKLALVRMLHGKCAYCESRITHVDYGHIEHFRPKAGLRGRPDLAFTWTNLLLSCGICNDGGHKGDRFPEADEGGPLVNPCDDEPAAHFQFHFDPILKIASVYGVTTRGVVTEMLFGLNRPDLRSYRSTRIRHLAALAKLAKSNDEAANLLQMARQADAPYAAFARALAT